MTMNYQLTLLGGQITPLYLGIMERKPNKVFFMCSEESKPKLPQLLSALPDLEYDVVTISPYDFEEITQRVETLLNEHPKATWDLNMTGGTKIMALATYQIFLENKMTAFYWKSGTLYFPSDHKEIPIQSTIQTDVFFKLSGNTSFTSEVYRDISEAEIEFAQSVRNAKSIGGGYYSIQNEFTKKKKQSSEAEVKVEKNGFLFHWKSQRNELIIGAPSFDHSIKFIGGAGCEIAFNGRWWELVIAKALHHLPEINEMHINVQLPYQSSKDTKNQIDILLNLGTSLLFVECKSGQINADDLNKMKAIKNLYGGIGSKTLLVTRDKPKEKVVEKCKELKIDYWSERVHDDGTDGFETLIQKITDVSNSSEQMM